MRQRVGVVRHRIDIEEHRTRNMLLKEIILRQRQHAGHLERGVENFHARIVQMRGQPFGGNKRIGCHG